MKEMSGGSRLLHFYKLKENMDVVCCAKAGVFTDVCQVGVICTYTSSKCRRATGGKCKLMKNMDY